VGVVPEWCCEGMGKLPLKKPVDVSLEYLLETEHRRPSGTPCKTCMILKEVSDDDAEALRAYLADPLVTTSQIVRALNRFGCDISHASVLRHRTNCR
jgi:hypothetical protein